MAAPTTGDVPKTSISPEALYERLVRGEPISILDTRDRDDFSAWHVDGPAVRAIQVPHVRFLQAEVTGTAADLASEYDLDDPVVTVCARGKSSDHAAALLRDVGIDAVNVAGGMDAWARAYVAATIDRDDLEAAGLSVRQYVRPSSGCLAYLVQDGSEAIVVDPLRAFVDRYVGDAADLGVAVVAAVDTHVHADHLSGSRQLAERTGATAYLPEGAIERGLDFDAALLADGDHLRVGDSSVTAVSVPGHTSEMTAFRLGDVLLSGDSLFVESVARPDLEAGDEGAPKLAARFHESLHDRILPLPDETLVAPGHVGPRTAPGTDGTFAARLGDLRERLDLLGLKREAFVGRLLSDVPPRPANYETIIAANLGREDVGEEEGFELELGPNNCAVSA